MSREKTNLSEENKEIEQKSLKETEFVNALDSNKDAPETVNAKENIATLESNSDSKKPKGRAVAAVTVSAATAVIAIASFSVISSSGLINMTMDAKINSMEYVDDGVNYNLTLKDVKSNNSIFFNVMNGNDVIYKIVIPVDNKNQTFEGDIEGHFSLSELNLVDKFTEKKEVSYTLRLCGNTGLVERTYDSWILDIKTMESVFNKVTYKCNCAVDGYFNFTMDYVDNYSIFTGFEATLEDSTGLVEKCEFTSNYHDTQKILAVNLLSDAVFTIKVNKNDKKDSDGNKIYEIIYQSNVVL